MTGDNSEDEAAEAALAKATGRAARKFVDSRKRKTRKGERIDEFQANLDGVEAIEVAHHMSLSSDLYAASFGRLYKALLGPALQWLDGERTRPQGSGIDRQMAAIQATANMVVSLSVTIVGRMVRPAGFVELLTSVRASVDRAFEAAIVQAKNDGAASFDLMNKSKGGRS
jgi:hypothetical protein